MMLDETYKKLTKPYEEKMMKSLKEFVAIDSVYDEDTASRINPFGKGVSQALKYIENLARNDGFEVHNYDNMVVEIICGSGDKNITVMAHADVVPEGKGWDQDPFEVVEKNGELFGRGVADDKGPLLSCYYGLLALKENNLLGDYKVRFLVGGNEESGSLCMEHYFHTLKKEQPTLGFSPDSDYPLIFAEKGIFNFKIIKDFSFPQIVFLKAGLAANSVIERCDIRMVNDLEFIDHLKNNNINFIYQEDGLYMNLAFLGKSAHGSMPQLGINAGMIAIKELGDFYNHETLKQIYSLYSDLEGNGLNAVGNSEEMGHNSVNVGLINYEKEHFEMVTNFRFVNTCNEKELKENIAKANKGFTIEFSPTSPLLFYPKDSKLVQTLLKVYQDETGDLDTPPQSTGGGTYAKEAENVVAFGMQMPGYDSKMHSVGECTTRKVLVISMAIYARAIIELGKIL